MNRYPVDVRELSCWGGKGMASKQGTWRGGLSRRPSPGNRPPAAGGRCSGAIQADQSRPFGHCKGLTSLGPAWARERGGGLDGLWEGEGERA